jgi:hypothetical protein
MKRSSSVPGLMAAIAMVIVVQGTPVHAKVIETLDDGCSGDVVVKVPYAGSGAPSLDGQDIILARSKAMCTRVEGAPGSPPTHKGVCQHDPNEKSSLTDPIPYSSIKNSDRRFRWFCNLTAERSRCKSGTKRVRFLIGPDRLFQTLCLDD